MCTFFFSCFPLFLPSFGPASGPCADRFPPLSPLPALDRVRRLQLRRIPYPSVPTAPRAPPTDGPSRQSHWQHRARGKVWQVVRDARATRHRRLFTVPLPLDAFYPTYFFRLLPSSSHSLYLRSLISRQFFRSDCFRLHLSHVSYAVTNDSVSFLQYHQL
jgi:hypothetical protein